MNIPSLIDALPFIQEFRGRTVVVKYGGSAMEDPALVQKVLQDVAVLNAIAIRAVVVHGGGKSITQRMTEAGIQAQFVCGIRVTDPDSIKIVESVLDREVNPAVVKDLQRLGASAAGVSGKEVFLATKAPPIPAGDGSFADPGLVGDIVRVNLAPIRECFNDAEVPVVSPIGRDEHGVVYNINADISAMELAIALRAAKLIYISDVPGVLRDPSDPASLIPTIRIPDIARLTADGVLKGGMIPKLDSAKDALERGVGKVQFIDGRQPHSLLAEMFTDTGCGTEIVP